MKKITPFIFAFFVFLSTHAQVVKLGEVEDKAGTPTVFSIDHQNRYIVLGNELGILSLFDANTLSEVYKVRPHSNPIEFLAFYPGEDEIVTSTEDEIIFSKINDGSQSSSISVFKDIEHLDIDPTSNQLFVVARLKMEESPLKQVFKVDLASRKYDPIYSGSGVQDIGSSKNGEYLFLCKGSKIFALNVNLGLVEKTLQSDETKNYIDYNPKNQDWIVSNDRMLVRYWKISSGRSYALRWNAISSTENTDRIYEAWALNEENKLLFFGDKGLKIRDIKNPSGDLEIKSSTAMDIKQVGLSTDRNKILFMAAPRTVEIWKVGESDDIPSSGTQMPTTSSAVVQVNTTDEIYTKYKSEIDKELNLRADLFKPRGEFERSDDYANRQKEAEDFKQKVFDYYRGVANREAEVAKELERTRLKILAERKKEDSLRKVALYRDKIVDSYEEFYTRISAIGSYDPDKEQFPITIDEVTEVVRVPFDQAREFKEGHLYFKVVGVRQLKQDGFTQDTFNYKIITDKGQVYDFGKQRKPLFVSGENHLLAASINRGQSKLAEPVPVVNNVPNQFDQPSNNVDNSIFNYFKDKQYHALIIGVNEYKDTRITQLDGPIGDASKLRNVLNSKYTFDDENIIFLQNPTRTEIIESFDKLHAEIGENDNLLIFYAGHGIWDEDLKQGFWLPSDSKIDSKAAWLSNAMIRDYIGGINAKHTLLVADACFSGGIFKTREIFVQNRASLELAKLPSRKAITSGAMKTVPDRSVFLEYLIKRLEQNENLLLPTEQLFSSFKIAVMNNSEGQVPQYGDIQGAGDEGGDFVFVKR